MVTISDVFLLDVSDKEELNKYRSEKYCVCVSVLNNKCLLINSENRKIYDELEVNSSDYQENGTVRYVACKNPIDFKEGEVIKKLGNLSHSNMVRITDKLKSKNRNQLIDIIAELDKWLENYTKNKLADTYKKR